MSVQGQAKLSGAGYDHRLLPAESGRDGARHTVDYSWWAIAQHTPEVFVGDS